ncbi:hypothetical protein H0266_16355 [Halobacillus locisalis]|uniref:TraB family protein n=1 Tax=Halobacillus locisalis TaxID=220753 RepID=A0A838CWF3_9BACI|nr:DUF5694 domain-containing protein [Halobacillus locisalis]MBA2176472.1 hypothetical protein [Halobacillus locisalis]
MSKPEILLVGMFHMTVDPTSVNEEQEEIIRVSEKMKKFEPTKIAVEKSFYVEEEMNKRYQSFLKGDLQLAYDEVEQLGFRIAKAMDHPQLYSVDEIVDMSSPTLEQVFEWAKEHQPELFKNLVSSQQSLQQSITGRSISDKLTYINSAAYQDDLPRIYMKISRIGDRQHQVGVHWLKQWHQRDLAIAANISRIVKNGDRLLVLIGADHLHLLQQFLKDSQDYKLIYASEYF